MKKLILFSIVALALLSFTGAETLKWHSLPDGLELSHSRNKPILLFVYAPWCDMCKRMEKKVFNNKEIAPLISEKFILVKINVDVDTAYLKSDKVLSRKIFLRDAGEGRMALGVPTTVLFRDKEKEPMKIQGVQEVEDFKTNIHQYLEK